MTPPLGPCSRPHSGTRPSIAEGHSATRMRGPTPRRLGGLYSGLTRRISELRFRAWWYPLARPPNHRTPRWSLAARHPGARRVGKQEGRPNGRPGRLGSGDRIRTCDLRDMSRSLGTTGSNRAYTNTDVLQV